MIAEKPKCHKVEVVRLRRTSRDARSLDKSRRFPALAMVCKQIREEFRPMYLNSLSTPRITIAYADLPAFLNTFYNHSDDWTFTPRSLTIWLGSAEQDKYVMNLHYVDILPLLDMKVLNPEFRCTFQDRPLFEPTPAGQGGNPKVCTELNRLLSGPANRGLRRRFSLRSTDLAHFKELRVYRWQRDRGTKGGWIQLVLVKKDTVLSDGDFSSYSFKAYHPSDGVLYICK